MSLKNVKKCFHLQIPSIYICIQSRSIYEGGHIVARTWICSGFGDFALTTQLVQERCEIKLDVRKQIKHYQINIDLVCNELSCH